MNRIERLLPSMRHKDPSYNMRTLLSKLSPSVIIPDIDKYYVFVYKAKTPNIRYDMHPFVVVTGIYQWGFSGFNFHWNDYRRYSWQEVVSNLYEINQEELNTMESVPIAKFRSS